MPECRSSVSLSADPLLRNTASAAKDVRTSGFEDCHISPGAPNPPPIKRLFILGAFDDHDFVMQSFFLILTSDEGYVHHFSTNQPGWNSSEHRIVYLFLLDEKKWVFVAEPAPYWAVYPRRDDAIINSPSIFGKYSNWFCNASLTQDAPQSSSTLSLCQEHHYFLAYLPTLLSQENWHNAVINRCLSLTFPAPLMPWALFFFPSNLSLKSNFIWEMTQKFWIIRKALLT